MPCRAVGRSPLPEIELWHVKLAVDSRCRPYSPESGIGICRMSTEFLRNWKCNFNGVDGVMVILIVMMVLIALAVAIAQQQVHVDNHKIGFLTDIIFAAQDRSEREEKS